MPRCVIPICNHHSSRSFCQFFPFPKDARRRRIWKIKTQMREDPNDGDFKVCSCHFPGGDESQFPLIFNIHQRKSRRKSLSPDSELEDEYTLPTSSDRDPLAFDSDETEVALENGGTLSDSVENECYVNPQNQNHLLNKTVTKRLTNWYFDHRKNPYPTQQQKLKLIEETQLSESQLDNWFQNAHQTMLPDILRICKGPHRQINPTNPSNTNPMSQQKLKNFQESFAQVISMTVPSVPSNKIKFLPDKTGCDKNNARVIVGHKNVVLPSGEVEKIAIYNRPEVKKPKFKQTVIKKNPSSIPRNQIKSEMATAKDCSMICTEETMFMYPDIINSSSHSIPKSKANKLHVKLNGETLSIRNSLTGVITNKPYKILNCITPPRIEKTVEEIQPITNIPKTVRYPDREIIKGILQEEKNKCLFLLID